MNEFTLCAKIGAHIEVEEGREAEVFQRDGSREQDAK